MSKSYEKFEIAAEVIKETDNALLVDLGEENPIWIPKSQIHEDSEVWEDGHSGILVIPEWLAIEKGIV